MKHYTELKDSHKGETGLVVANGPGLAKVSDEFLSSYPSFGCNRISARHPGYCPTYYVGMGFNQLDTPEKRKDIEVFITDARCEVMFINRHWVHEYAYPKVLSVLGGRAYGAKDSNLRDFSFNPLHYMGIGYSIVYCSLQIAYYMGFTTILLVGMDHTYEGAQGHFYPDDKYPEFEKAPGPYTPKAWQNGANMVFTLANDAYRKNKRRIINLSEPTACEVFERGRIEDWMT